MSDRGARQSIAKTTSMGSDLSEEVLAEVDEPPDEVKGQFCWSPPNLCKGYMRPCPRVERRESLLTRQLHSETEPTDNDEPKSPMRALSTQSTWSSISMPSTAELTSDDGHSVASIAGSPPPPPPNPANRPVAVTDKSPEQKVKIVGQDDVVAGADKPPATEQSVEANLGRKRCISFACRGKQEAKPPTPSEPAQTEPKSPPKRKCMLKFVCPSRAEASTKAVEKPPAKRSSSPPPPERRPSPKHRGSDSTITHSSPARASTVLDTDAKREGIPTAPPLKRAYSNESDEDSCNEGTRFHEFATSEDEPEDWTRMSTCHRARLTVEDTLKKENVIRKTCEEVEEEALEEEEEEEEDEEAEGEEVAVADTDGDDGIDDEADDTDEGFHSDDEGGFASSDEENDSDSDFEWWRPGGVSTAATSVEQLDRLAIVNSRPGTSIGSASSSPTSPRASKVSLRRTPSKQRTTPAMDINRAASPDLPDTSDFVCGTLDEDRSLEEAFLLRRKQKIASKRPVRPQDIDPTFPTSDPEMDEEDDDDVDDAAQSDEAESMMHGKMDESDGHGLAMKRSPFRLSRIKSNVARSPPPPARHHSPPPLVSRRSIARSPAPPRRLFGHSPHRMGSPAPVKRMTSPPNSPTGRSAQQVAVPQGLALFGRPQLTHTSSLPRGGLTSLSKLGTIRSEEDEDGVSDVTASTNNMEIPKRGAIDIVKGLEKKRAWRKKKLAQKMCAKAANKPEKPHKVKPGTGAQRMREVGLQLQDYQGKAEHILSL